MGVRAQGLEHSRHRYQVVPRTLIFITNRDNKVLLIRGASTKRIWPDLYNGVGGHIEAGETVLDAALREIREETGLTDIHDLCLRATVHITTEDPMTGILLFVFTAATTDTADLQPSPEGTPEWVDWRELNSDLLVEDLPILLPKVLGPGEVQRPCHGCYRYDEADQLRTTWSQEPGASKVDPQ